MMGCLLFDDSIRLHGDELHLLPSCSRVAHQWCCGQDLTPVLTGEEMNLYGNDSAQVDVEILYGKKYARTVLDQEELSV